MLDQLMIIATWNIERLILKWPQKESECGSMGRILEKKHTGKGQHTKHNPKAFALSTYP